MFDGKIKRIDQDSKLKSHDWLKILNRFDQNIPLIEELVNELYDGKQNRMAELANSIADRDFNAIALNAHSLIGVVGYFDGEIVKGIARRMQTDAKLNRDTDYVSMFKKLDTEMDRLCNDLLRRVKNALQQSEMQNQLQCQTLNPCQDS